MSHFILRTIAPSGILHTYEFNKNRADKAREEFRRNKVDMMVIVHDRDVCGKQPTSSSSSSGCVILDNTEDNNNHHDDKGPGGGCIATTPKSTATGFGIGGQVADAIFLDLPEPWLAVPHAAYTIKPDGRLCSYSPCVEQTQRCVTALRESGFHSIKTIEARLREYYVDDVELECPPKGRLPRVGVADVMDGTAAGAVFTTTADADDSSAKEPSESESGQSISSKKHHRFPDSEDTGAEGDNERSEAEDMLVFSALERSGGPSNNSNCPTTGGTTALEKIPTRRKKLCVRPFPVMRGHTAFLTFATAGRKVRPNPLLV
jgi:tRNA (adenine57-N1/adenine58-N1)-methyltransferase